MRAKTSSWVILTATLLFALAFASSSAPQAQATESSYNSEFGAGYSVYSMNYAHMVTFIEGSWTVPPISCQSGENGSARYEVGTPFEDAVVYQEGHGSALDLRCNNGYPSYALEMFAGSTSSIVND